MTDFKVVLDTNALLVSIILNDIPIPKDDIISIQDFLEELNSLDSEEK